jgi:hypothetical protein
MTAPDNSPLILTLLAAFIACTGYAGGRLHQWYRMGRDRDDAFRDGYDTATHSVFSLAARVLNPRRADRSESRTSAAVILPASAVTTTDGIRPPESPSPGSTSLADALEPAGRHTVPDELVRAATYRLNPDRLARAKVPGVVPPEDSSVPEWTPRVSVPKARVS